MAERAAMMRYQENEEITMKRTILILTLAMVLALSACGALDQTGAGQDAESQKPAESLEAANTDTPPLPPAEAAPSQTDWRDGSEISARGTMTFRGEPVDVCVCAEDTEALIYRDDPVQELLARAGYPILLENAAGSFHTCDFEDIDQDGSSDLTMDFVLPDGTRALFLWFWVDREGYVLNEEFTQLPGE